MLFSGGRNPFHAGFGAILTDLIDAMTKFVEVSPDRHVKMSHSAVAMPSNGNAPYIYESTIENGISGPRKSDLADTLAGYGKQGGHAWLFPFLPQFRPDWDALEVTAQHMIALRQAGLMPYNVKRLFDDAEERSLIFSLLALPFDGIITYEGAHSRGVVCSEMAGLLLQGGGVPDKCKALGVPWLPNVNPPGQPIGDSPADVGNMPIYYGAIQLV